MSLAETDVTDVRCTGLVQDVTLRQTEFIFRARCALAKHDIEARLDPEEHRAVQAIAATEAGIASALPDPALTPVAVAALLLWGRGVFGDAWFSRHLRR